MKNFSPFVVLLISLAIGCGDNLQTPPIVVSLDPPTALKALAVNQSSINVQWSAAVGSSDSSFRGYIVGVGSRQDTLPKSALSFTAMALPSGESVFLISSLLLSGAHSDAATIRWAPAARFDSAFTVFESNTIVSIRPEGFNVGTSTTNPSVMLIDLTDPLVQRTMDLYINGGTRQMEQPLALWSANLYFGNFNRTLFSTQMNFSPTLDYPLPSFPSDITFIKDTITIVDNTIYYAKVIGDPQQVNYARIHVRIRPGTSFPNRVVEIRVSLQRVPGLLYAFDAREVCRDMLQNSRMFSLINTTTYNQMGVL